MPFTIYVKMKKTGKQRKADLQTVTFELEARPQTVRELIVMLTKCSVRDFNERKNSGKLITHLTKDADPVKAVENAIQCFEDGIYRVFYGTEELTELHQSILWKDAETVFNFIRLTMLTGW